MPRISDEAVKEKTGRTWDEWFTLLDQDQAAQLPHPQIAKLLKEKHQVGPWWCQSVTVEYEKARGLRVLNERCAGEFAASASKTIAATPEQVFTAFEDAGTRAAWLPDAALTVRTASAPKSIRFDHTDSESRVAVHLYEKGGKTAISLEHEKLSDAAAAEQWKVFWKDRLGVLKTHLEVAK